MARKRSEPVQLGQRNTAVRVLVKCAHGNPDDVVQLDAETLASAVALGQVDPHPDAVTYAASLK